MIQDKKGQTRHTDKPCLALVRFWPRNFSGYVLCVLVTVRVLLGKRVTRVRGAVMRCGRGVCASGGGCCRLCL